MLYHVAGLVNFIVNISYIYIYVIMSYELIISYIYIYIYSLVFCFLQFHHHQSSSTEKQPGFLQSFRGPCGAPDTQGFQRLTLCIFQAFHLCS